MKIVKTRIWLVMVVTLLVLAVACQKKGNESNGPAGVQQPLKNEHGAVAGAIVQKTIGPAGGSMVSEDGRLKLTVPAGTVSANTVFSIQPVENTLGAGTGLSYRLLPSDVNFSQPVEIGFNYDATDLEGTAADYLYLAFQDEEGYWHRANMTALDKTNKTLTVKTKHFSDWTIEKSLSIVIVGQKVLKANEETGLQVINEPVIQTSSDGSISSISTLEAKNIKEWKVYGGGSLSSTKTVGTIYKAPGVITTSSTATVEVTLVDVVDAIEPDRPGTGGMVILRTTLNLVNDEFFYWTFKGQSFSGGATQASSYDGHTSMIVYNGENALNIVFKGQQAGSYTSTEMTKTNSMAVLVSYDKKTFVNSHTPCDADKPIFEKGFLTITKFEKGYIEGNISAGLIRLNECATQTGMVMGSFRIKVRE